MQSDLRGIERPLEYIEKRRFNALKEITSVTITRERIEARRLRRMQDGSRMSIEISDSAVETALKAVDTFPCYDREALMRAALSAALPLIVGEPVAWADPSDIENKFVPLTVTRAAYLFCCTVPLYAIKQGASRE